MSEPTKHKFYYGEETYTICVTKDDWWLEESVDMSELMMKCGEEFALDHGMLPPEGLCVECRKGKYVDVVEDYHIGGTTIKDLDLHRCYRCGHTTLPWQSVEKVDKVLEAAKKPAELCPTCRESMEIKNNLTLTNPAYSVQGDPATGPCATPFNKAGF